MGCEGGRYGETGEQALSWTTSDRINPDVCMEPYERAWNVFAAITPIVEPADYHCGKS